MTDIYEPGNRARCIVCLEELQPAPSSHDGEPTYSGFLPCPDHPKAAAIYRHEVTGSPSSPAIAVTPHLSLSASSTLHHLKTWPRFFVPAWAALKPFEVRINDRGFMAGDGIILEEWDPNRKCQDPNKQGPCKDVCICRYTGRQIQGRITYVLDTGTISGIAGGMKIPSKLCVFGYIMISRTVSP